MNYREKYRARMSVMGSTPREQIINDAIDDFTEYMNNTPNGYKATINNDTVNKYDIAIQDVSIQNGMGDEKYLVTYMATPIDIGDVINMPDFTYNPWITVKQDYVTVMTHRTFQIRPCDFELKWVSKYGKSISKWVCSLNTTMYTLGIDNGQQITLPDTKLSITVSEDDDTTNIKRGMRFMYKGNKPYKVTFDDRSINGIINFTLTEDIINPKDDLENGIAWNDYSTYSILLPNELQLKANDAYQLQPNVLKDNVQVTEELVYASDNELIATVDENGLITCLANGNCNISVKLKNNESINKIVILSVLSTPVQAISIDLLAENIMSGMSGEVTCKVYKNGIDDSNNYTYIFRLLDYTNATITTVNNNVCTIVAKDNPYTSCTVEVVVDNNASYIVQKTIEIEGWF